jgi:hypothetical protein
VDLDRWHDRVLLGRGRRGAFGTPQRVVKELYGSDNHALAIVERGAVVPASTTNTTALGQTSISDLVTLLGPSSAAAEIFALESRSLSWSRISKGAAHDPAPSPVTSFAFRRKIRAETAADREFAGAYRSGVFLLLLDAPPLAPCNQTNEIQGSEVVSIGGGKRKNGAPVTVRAWPSRKTLKLR